MLLEERFSDLVDIVDIHADMSIFKVAKKALQEFFQLVDEQFQGASPKVRPGTYYAILLADGDSMGKIIDHQAAAADGEGQHRELSKVLANFSGKVRTIVEGDKDKKGHQGSLIYAGGDDVLAFLPLHTVIGCAQKLSEAFYDALKNFKDKDNKSPTLSVGVATIHHLQPLREALELARYAEKSAKHVEGKNALAITISKRSGGDFTVKGQWKSFAVHLNELIEICRQESIPEGTAYELRELSLKLAIQADDPESQLIRPVLQEAMKTDAQRILERKLTHHRRNKPNDEDTMRHQRITALLEESEDIEHFANELIAAQFFADAMELAEPTKGTPQ